MANGAPSRSKPKIRILSHARDPATSPDRRSSKNAMDLLTRYWFEFEPIGGIVRYAGVTAYSLEDAQSLLSEKLFPAIALPRIVETLVNVDISTLDENHILPNIGRSNFRGVWYPNLI